MRKPRRWATETELAAKERKDRKKERDRNLLERWKFECEHRADNRDTSDLTPYFFVIFLRVLCLFAAIPSLRSLHCGYPCLYLILAPLGFNPRDMLISRAALTRRSSKNALSELHLATAGLGMLTRQSFMIALLELHPATAGLEVLKGRKKTTSVHFAR